MSPGKNKYRLPKPEANVVAAGKAFGPVHSIVMALANDCGEYFLVTDLQAMTLLPAVDVAFALRDLVRAGFISTCSVPRIYKVKRS